MTAMILDPNPKPPERAPDGLKIPNVILAAALAAMVGMGGFFGTYVTSQLSAISVQLGEARERMAGVEASMRSVEFRLARIESTQDRLSGGSTNGRP